jgi:hypothetical protein
MASILQSVVSQNLPSLVSTLSRYRSRKSAEANQHRVIEYMKDSVPRLKELELHFPVAFGPDFRSVLVLDHLIHIQRLQESEIGPDPTMNCRFNVVDIAGNGYGVLPEMEQYLLADTTYSLSLSRRTGGAIGSTGKGVIGMPGSELPALQTSNNIVVGETREV